MFDIIRIEQMFVYVNRKFREGGEMDVDSKKRISFYEKNGGRS